MGTSVRTRSGATDMTGRTTRIVGVTAIALLAGTIPSSAAAQTVERPGWEVPRTLYGHPDLQGNWTNATMTPVQRPEGQGPTLTAEQVAAMEGARQDRIEERAAPSDPDLRAALPVTQQGG